MKFYKAYIFYDKNLETVPPEYTVCHFELGTFLRMYYKETTDF
jgi:hypothetical protein